MPSRRTQLSMLFIVTAAALLLISLHTLAAPISKPVTFPDSQVIFDLDSKLLKHSQLVSHPLTPCKLQSKLNSQCFAQSLWSHANKHDFLKAVEQDKASEWTVVMGNEGKLGLFCVQDDGSHDLLFCHQPVIWTRWCLLLLGLGT